MLSLQTCSEVRDHGDGRADLLGDVVDKNFLAVGSDVVEDLRSGCGYGDLLRRPELRGSIDFLDTVLVRGDPFERMSFIR